MKLLADENFPGPVIDGLAGAGLDVLSVARAAPGIDDLAVLRMACNSGRRLLTFDSDFGDLVFLRGADAPPAILYFRIHPIIIASILDAARRAVATVPDGFFAVIGSDTIRLRRLPAVTARD